MPRARFVVHGRVQGVGFRWFVWQQAERLALRGTAENLPEGSVEVVAEGPSDALAELERALAHGPPMARVERVERFEVPHDIALPKRFEIN
ncbi:MAG TPA: acylphosphatase [Gemmatimonadales bacterium]|nr:acylphosphatase [Gemmatimonadales bacterium]